MNKRFAIIFLLVLNSILCSGQTFLESKDVLISSSYDTDTSCNYDKMDSVFIVFEKGFEGRIECLVNNSFYSEINAVYYRSIERVLEMFVVRKENKKQIIKIKYQMEEISFSTENKFNVIYLKREKNTNPIWYIYYSNCYYITK